MTLPGNLLRVFLLFLLLLLAPHLPSKAAAADGARLNQAAADCAVAISTFTNSGHPYDVVQVDCSGRGLKAVPNLFQLLTDLPTATSFGRVILDLSDNEIEEIKAGDFAAPPTNRDGNERLLEIRSIDLRRNKITYIEDSAFSSSNIHGLQYLYLAENEIEVFHEFTFARQRFEVLDLSHNLLRSFPYAIKRSYPQRVLLNNNPIGNLPNDAFTERRNVHRTHLTSIRELDLSGIGMTTFDSCALRINKTLLSLTKLYLDDNKFVTVTRSFFPCMVKTLNTLSLKNCQTQSYEREAFSSSDYKYNVLRYLDLSGNNLTVLDRRVFHNLDNLIHLYLSNCGITNILRNAFLRTSVSGTLDLSHNNITEIHNRDFYDMTNVRTIDLSHSNIQRISGRPFERMTRLESLDLSYNNLTTIDGSEFDNVPSLLSLDLSHSNIQVLDRRPFKSLQNLRSLDLTYNNISEIKSQVFYRLVSLRDLRLTHSNIQRLSNMSFVTLDSLEELDLSHNNISVIEDNVFAGLINVRTLSLSHSFVHSFTGHPFEKMPKLELLFLDKNLLTVDTFILALRGIRNLHTLDLSHNMFTKVPNLSIEDFPHLTNLWLGFNNIRTITRADLRGMSFIRQLILKDNLIEKIEYDAFAECPNITVLDMDDSRLSTLPDLKYMPQMRNLHLNRGRLTELPADLCKSHRYLTILEVEENFLKSLPTFSACIPGLTIGEFAHNLISSLQNDTFANQGLLRRLNLEHNLITDLPDGLLDDARNLADLKLSHNQLTSLSPQIFENSLNLVSLDASYNNIQSLDEGLFKNNTEMDILYLNNNRIGRIDDRAFSEHSALRGLDLSNNNFSSWSLPQGGFPYLHSLNLAGNPKFVDVPSTSETPRMQHVKYTYAQHCCQWKDYAYVRNASDDVDIIRVTPLPPTVVPTADESLPDGWESCSPDEQRNREQLEALQSVWNFTVEILPDCKIQVHYGGRPSDTETTVPPTAIPATSQPVPDGWENCSLDDRRNREQLEALQSVWNFTVEILPDCKIQVHYGGRPLDGGEEGVSEQDEFAPLVDDFTSINRKIDRENKMSNNKLKKVVCLPQPLSCSNVLNTSSAAARKSFIYLPLSMVLYTLLMLIH